jgi:hypothetical protein
MSSSRKSKDQILGVISRKRAESLLLDWVNLPNDIGIAPVPGPIERMSKLYPEVFANFQGPEGPRKPGEAVHTERSTRRSLLHMLLATVRDDLRGVWDAPDARQRDWQIFRMRQSYWQDGLAAESVLRPQGEKTNTEQWNSVPDVTPFEAVMFYLQTYADRTRHCPSPLCPAPYFLAAKRSQKYCSEACAGPALREAKRRWWNENRAKNGELA